MNKSQLIEALSNHFGGNKKAAQHALESVLDTITREVAKGEKVAITGFGAFERTVRPARMVRNPRTGERIHAKKTAVPKFRAGTELKDVVSGAKPLPAVAVAAARPTAKKTSTASAAKKTAKKATKKSTAKKTAKKAAKKTTAAKRTAKKTARKTAKKAPARKSTAKKTARKATAKRPPARKTAAKKTTAAKRTAKKAPARKTAKRTAKKTARKATKKR